MPPEVEEQHASTTRSLDEPRKPKGQRSDWKENLAVSQWDSFPEHVRPSFLRDQDSLVAAIRPHLLVRLARSSGLGQKDALVASSEPGSDSVAATALAAGPSDTATASLGATRRTRRKKPQRSWASESDLNLVINASFDGLRAQGKVALFFFSFFSFFFFCLSIVRFAFIPSPSLLPRFRRFIHGDCIALFVRACACMWVPGCNAPQTSRTFSRFRWPSW